MRVPMASLIGLALVGGAAGCHCGSKSQLAERELRAREEDVRALREELDRCEAYNQAMFQDLRNFRGDGCVAHPAPACVERPIGLAPVCSIVLGRQTGGHNEGSCAGDDALEVQVEPRDPDGHPVKVAASLGIQLLEINKEGLKRPLSSWDVGPDQLRGAWRQGLFSSGYVLTLPWKVWPTTDKLRVVAQFRPVDGRAFEAEKDITVHLPPPEQRRVLPLPECPGGLPPGPIVPPAAVGTHTEQILDANLGPGGTATEWRPATPAPPAAILRPAALSN